MADAYDDAIEELSNHAKEIVDAYGFTEWELDSALAKPNVTPYEALFKGAQASELNFQHLDEKTVAAIISTRNVWKDFQQEKAKL